MGVASYPLTIESPNFKVFFSSNFFRSDSFFPSNDSAKIRRLMGISGGLHSPLRGFW